MIRAILFDFNGVIIDDEPLQLQAYQEALKPEGIALTEEDYYNSLGTDEVTFVIQAFARAGKELSDEALTRVLKRKTELHRRMLEGEPPLFPGVINFIKACARRYTLGIVSMSRRREIADILNRTGLETTFTVIVSAEDVQLCKPNPECFNRAFRLLNEARYRRGESQLSPAECLAIEDSPPGVRAARAAGMRTLAVTNTVSAHLLREAGAEIVTPNLADWTPEAIHRLYDPF
ncbi:MAG: HAD family phosphatase [Pyrinomonas methylaliphatogenes]|nr:HAD family phosphatase [Pyrinomonas methylaliphatogenes]